MDYWDNYDINELNFIKEKLLNISNDFEIKLNILNGIIDDINSSIEGRKY